MTKLKDVSNKKIKVYIASDHAGYETKEAIINSKELDFIEFVDLGTNSLCSVDYPDYAKKLGETVVSDSNSYGIGICGTGIGISIALNKVKKVRCALVTNKEVAPLARQHNNANVIALSGRFVSVNENVEIIKKFFNATFEERHQTRLDKISKMECC